MSKAPRPRRPSQVRHRRESFWQITLPMLVAILVVGLAFALVVLAGPVGISGVADLAITLLSVPLLLLCLLPLALVFAVLVGVLAAQRAVPRYTQIAQDTTARVTKIVTEAMKRITDAVIPAIAGFQVARRFLGGRKPGGSGGSPPDNKPPAP